MMESRAYDNDYGDPVVVLVVTGTHDVSRLVHVLTSGNCEQGDLGRKITRQVRRQSGGQAALELLKHHGGADFTEPETVTVDVQDLIGVLAMASLTEHRSDGEQMELLRTARAVDVLTGVRRLQNLIHNTRDIEAAQLPVGL